MLLVVGNASIDNVFKLEWKIMDLKLVSRYIHRLESVEERPCFDIEFDYKYGKMCSQVRPRMKILHIKYCVQIYSSGNN